MSTPRDHILDRLRRGARTDVTHPNPVTKREAEWSARQPPIGDFAERFTREQQAVGSQVRHFPTWEALAQQAPAWLRGLDVHSVITGRVPRLDPLRQSLGAAGFALRTYDRPAEQQQTELFNTDCGITTSVGGIAETGSIILIPSPAEPRLLSLAVPVHLAIVARGALWGTLLDFIRGGVYQQTVPTNLVLVSCASRTADIELTLAMGVHGPKVLLVALVG
jgi:L-lactate dehydrogenase complex protein LldG